jgi:hypothetical protein
MQINKIALSLLFLLLFQPILAYSQSDSIHYQSRRDHIPAFLDMIDVGSRDHYSFGRFLIAQSDEITLGVFSESHDNIFRINQITLTLIPKDNHNSNYVSVSLFPLYQLAVAGLEGLFISGEGLDLVFETTHDATYRSLILLIFSPIMLANSELHQRLFQLDSIRSQSIVSQVFIRLKTDHFAKGDARLRFSPELGVETSLPISSKSQNRLGFQVGLTRQIDYFSKSNIQWSTNISFSLNYQVL